MQTPDAPHTATIHAIIQNKTPLLLDARPPKSWVLQLTIDGKRHIITGQRITVDGWTVVESSSDWAAVVAGELVHNNDGPRSEADGPEPKVGDRVPWDALVDGCLCLDDEHAEGGARYGMCADGMSFWLFDERDPDIDRCFGYRGEKDRWLSCSVSPEALVIAVGLRTPNDFRAAIAAHRKGGAE